MTRLSIIQDVCTDLDAMQTYNSSSQSACFNFKPISRLRPLRCIRFS